MCLLIFNFECASWDDTKEERRKLKAENNKNVYFVERNLKGKMRMKKQFISSCVMYVFSLLFLLFIFHSFFFLVGVSFMRFLLSLRLLRLEKFTYEWSLFFSVLIKLEHISHERDFGSQFSGGTKNKKNDEKNGKILWETEALWKWSEFDLVY